ncbi:MAG: SHOCT domain-containing protein [Bacillota bacterium]
MKNNVLYAMSLYVINKLRDSGLITTEEMRKIDEKNKKSFL